ncbi:MAG: hypothetical protein M0R22_11345 [Dehalococcoidia bacterium]|nr:hypothetical protein [Dehalococcoidia bacterium]
MATEWGIPPWQIEAEAPALWADRWVALRVERGKRVKHDNDSGQFAARGRRLI